MWGSGAPPPKEEVMMKYKNIKGWWGWRKTIRANKGEPYGEAVNEFAKDWAEAMEKEIKKEGK